MARAQKESLIRRVEAGRFEHAVFATYTLDIPFFEASVMRHVLRNGCRNAVVFADGHQLALEMNRLSEPGHSRTSWWYGKHYSLIPVHHTAAFHPKISFLIGEAIEVYVGSGNLEAGGLTSNLEIYHRVVCSRQDPDPGDASIVRQVWQYISSTLSTKVPSYARRQLHRIEEDIPWLKSSAEVTTDAQVVLGPGTDVASALKRSVGADKVDRLFIMSPFFDAKVGALDRLIQTLRPKTTILLVQPDTVSLPGSKLAGRKNLEIYAIDCDSYVHAKVVVAECSRSSILLAGSHNVSTPAFGGTNYEASLIRLNGKGSRFSELLGLTKHLLEKNRIPLEQSTLKLRNRGKDNGAAGNAWLASAQIDGTCVEIVTRKKLTETCRLIPLDSKGASSPLDAMPVVSDDGLRFVVSERLVCSAWTAIAVQDGADRSQPVPLLHVRSLENRARSPKEAEIGDQIKRLRTDINALPEILKNMSALLMSYPEHAQLKPKMNRKGGKLLAVNGPIHQLSYDDFVVPWQAPQEGHGWSPARRSNLEIAVAAIARAIEGRGKAGDIPEDDGLDLDLDSAFANKSSYREEVYAGGRLEENPDLIERMEQHCQTDEVVGLEQADGRGRKEIHKKSPTEEEDRLKSLVQARGSLKRFAKNFPIYLETLVEEENLSFDIFEKISSAGALTVQFVGRKMTAAKQEVELLSWESWTEFNINLFDVLSSSKTKCLSRFDWTVAQTELYRPTVERFMGYVAAVERLCRCEELTPEQSSRILVGILRVSRALGVNRGAVRDAAVMEAGQAILETFYTKSSGVPKLSWANWVEVTCTAVQLDEAFRSECQSVASVFAASGGHSTLLVGEWVWWQHADGHIGVVVESDYSTVEVAYEPGSTKPIKREYVVPLVEMAPARPLQRKPAFASW
jgi:hypothetical protein